MTQFFPLFSNFKFSYDPFFWTTVRCLKITEKHAKEKANTLRQKWQRIELLSLNNKTTIEDIKNLFSIRPNRERNANKHISSSTRNSINNGTKIYFRPRRKMLRPLESLRIDILLKLKATVKFWVTSSLLHSNSAQNYSTCKRSKIA